MREENYFEIKLQNSKDTLVMAESQIDHLDIQIITLKLRFEHDKKVYNDQIIHMQKIVEEMKKRIPKLEKRVNKGYKVFDVRANKGYKSFEAMHKAQLETKRLEAIENYRLREEKIERRRALKEKPQIALTEADKGIVESIKIQESLQEDHEIKLNQEKQLERLRKKREAIEEEIQHLGDVKVPDATDIEFDAVGNEINKFSNVKGMKLEDLEKELDSTGIDYVVINPSEIKKLEEDLEKEIVILPENKVIPHIDIVKTPNDELSKLESISQQMEEHKDQINGKIKDLMNWLKTKHQDWIDSYTLEEGGKAIYSGRITNGFRSWCESKGYKIGD